MVYQISKDQDSEWKGLSAAVFFIATSSSMVFINKSILSVQNFDCPFFIMALQMTFTFIILKVLSFLSIIVLPDHSNDVRFWPITIFYSMHSITALTAIGRMTIPMYTAVKRCGPLVIIAFSMFFLRKPLPSAKVLTSVIIITAGCFIAGFGDLAFSWSGYTFCSVSLIAQSIYLIFTQRAAECGVTALGILYITSYSSIPIFVIGTLFLEYSKLSKSGHQFEDTYFLSTLSIQVFLGIVLNYSLYLCTTLNSALTTSLVGVIKSVLQTAVGFFAFGGVPFEIVNVLGIGMNLCGGILYGLAKHQEISKKNLHLKAAPTLSGV